MLQPGQNKSLLSAILTAWLLAGTLDISSALILVRVRSDKNPIIVFNYIASAVFGKENAYAGGVPMIMAGLFFHYLIALIFTLIFFVLYPRIYGVIKNRFIAGILYGLFAWIIMNLVVVPLTRIPSRTITVSNAVENIVILMLAIGLPVSLIAYNYYYGKTK